MRQRNPSLGYVPLLICVIVVLIDRSMAAAEDASTKTTAAIRQMHDEVARIRVTVDRNSQKSTAELKPEPIFRYTDQQREFPDATLWAWIESGQPVAFSKLERFQNDKPKWQYCATAVNRNITLRWKDGIVWKSRKPGTEFKTLSNDAPPAKTAQLRLAQFRAIARKFRATTTSLDQKPEEMRLQPQPILRYSSTDQSILDGAVFAFSSNGTNPDALLLLQVLNSANATTPTWEFGCLGLTGDTVSIDFDEATVYKHEGADSPGDHGHWLWILRPIE